MDEESKRVCSGHSLEKARTNSKDSQTALLKKKINTKMDGNSKMCIKKP